MDMVRRSNELKTRFQFPFSIKKGDDEAVKLVSLTMKNTGDQLIGLRRGDKMEIGDEDATQVAVLSIIVWVGFGRKKRGA
ncbi:hypothetical protein Scep_019305 [Stephania cephalantha]|uniref:Uncharacterized protein n=1 Tax=Stephania cephalantha TaxID=152367 RepID=A0AAP0IAF8_9MAGN